MNKQPEVTQKTRQKFVDVFCTLYAEKPIEKISVQQITNLAGYNRSTFYQYFSDIYELRDYVENDVLTYITVEFSAGDGNPYEEQTVLRDAMRLFNEKETYLNALLGDYGSIRFQSRLKERMMTASGLKEKFSESELFPYLLEFHVSTLLSLFRLWQKRGKDLPPQKLFDMIFRLYSGAQQSLLENNA